MDGLLTQLFPHFVDALLELAALAAVLYARRKFTPGMFRKLIGVLLLFMASSAFLHLVKLSALLNPSSIGAGLNRDPNFGAIYSIVSSAIIVVLGYALVKLAKLYGFAQTNPLLPFIKEKEKPAFLEDQPASPQKEEKKK